MLIDLRRQKFFWMGTHEMHIQDVMSQYVKRGMVVYDVGAHIGFFTLLLARLVGDSGKVYAFEPFPANYDILVQNIRLNGFRNVRPLRLAVSNANGKIKFYPGARSSGTGTVAHRHEPSSEAIDIDAVSIDDFVSNGGNDAPDLLKIDVEGAGGHVLGGVRRVMKEQHPWILVEVHDELEERHLKKVLAAFPHRSKVIQEAIPAFRGRGFLYHLLVKPC